MKKLSYKNFVFSATKYLYHYLKWYTSNFPLSSPNGPPSREVPAIAINEASKDIKKVLEDSEDKDSVELTENVPRKTRQQSVTMQSCMEWMLRYTILKTFQTWSIWLYANGGKQSLLQLGEITKWAQN